MYYILIDTDNHKFGIRRATDLDRLNEKLLTDVFWMHEDRVGEIADTEWEEMAGKCEQLVEMFDKVGKSRGNF
jgi:hypothetical protein